MAETRTINLEVNDNSDETAKGFKKVADSIEDASKSVQDLSDSTKGAEGGIKKIGKGIKGIGLAFKAAGVGLIIAAFATLKEVFTQNQKVADALSAAFETISIVFNEVTRVIVDVYKSVSQATGGFDALGKVLGGLLTLVLAPLKAAFFGIKLGVEQVQLAWETSFFGDNDPTTISNLRDRIKGTKDDLLDVGKAVVSWW
jgi:ABC-type transporter Mla subunit MlaD